MKYKSLLFLCTFFLAASSMDGQELSLNEAHRLLLTANGRLQAAAIEVEEKEEELKAAKGLHLPSIEVSGNYMYLSEDIELDLNPARDMLGGILQIPDPQAVMGDWNMPLQERNFGMASAGLKWPLFTGGKIKAAGEAAEARVGLAQNKSDQEIEDLSIQLVDYYFKYKLATEAEDLYSRVEHTVGLHREQAEKLFENGQLAEVETLHAEVAFSSAHRDLLAAKKDVSLAYSAVKSLLGGASFDSLTTNFKTPVLLPPLNELQEEMLQESTKLVQLDKNRDLASAGVKVEQSEYFPKLALIASHNLWRGNMPLLSVDWYTGVGLSWNIFDGFQREHKIEAARHRIDRLDEIETQARMDLLTYTHLLYNNLEKQKEQYESLEADEELAQRLKFMRKRAFEEGMGTSLEVVDATLKLAQIQLKKLQALYEYNKAYGELMIRLGEEVKFLSQN